MKELQEISNKFQGHYMTKMNKQLKTEKEQLDKLNNEMVSVEKHGINEIYSKVK